MGKAPRYAKRPSASGTLVKLLAAAAGVSVLVLIIIVILVVRSAGSKEAPEETIPSEPTVQTATASGTEPSATTEVERVTTEPTEQAVEQTAEPTEETTAETTAETTVPETTRPKVTGSTGQNTSVSATKPTASGGTHTPDDGHTHGNYYDIPHLKANCTNPGTVYRQCGYCNMGMEIPDPVNYPPLGHDCYANIVVPPTTTSQGYTVYTCRRCGDNYDSDFTDPLPTEAPQPSEDASPDTPESET